MHVLVVEDDAEVVEVLSRSLAKDGHRVASAATLEDADLLLSTEDFEAVVLDIGLPDGSGLDWCKHARGRGVSTPILVLTARSAVSMRVAGLDSGADDYLAKPFAVAELRARVRALGRRAPIHTMRPYASGDVSLDFASRRATVAGGEVPLTAREWRIMEILTSRAGRVVSRAEILEAVWGDRAEARDASLEVLIGRIRKKLGAGFVRTVRGEGYASG